MRRPKIEHGKRGTYVRVCRCDECCKANTEYGQELKKRRRTGQKIQAPLATVTNLRAEKPEPDDDTPKEPGEVELVVIKEMKSLSAAQKHPGVVQSVIAMVRILDDRAAITTHPSAHRQMVAT